MFKLDDIVHIMEMMAILAKSLHVTPKTLQKGSNQDRQRGGGGSGERFCENAIVVLNTPKKKNYLLSRQFEKQFKMYVATATCDVFGGFMR